MEKKPFELTLDEVRAVIGGAIYYISVNKLPVAPLSSMASPAPTPVYGSAMPSIR